MGFHIKALFNQILFLYISLFYVNGQVSYTIFSMFSGMNKQCIEFDQIMNSNENNRKYKQTLTNIYFALAAFGRLLIADVLFEPWLIPPIGLQRYVT